MIKSKKKRTCTDCRLKKPLSDFYKDRSRPLGHTYLCKKCEYIKCRRHRKTRRVWNKNNKASVNKAVREYNKRNPDKQKARSIFTKAVKSGKIERQPCRECGKDKSHGHHEDYNKPLEVIWLCHQHHKDIHGGRL